MPDKYNQLHTYLLSALDDITTHLATAGIDRFTLEITCERDRDETPTIKYRLRERYESGPTGNHLGPVIEEMLRRYGWEVANNTKLISG